MEHFESFRRNINNPYNIKGFHVLFNKDNIREDVDVKEVEAKLLGEKTVTKFNPKEALNAILSKVKIPDRPGPIPKSFESDLKPLDRIKPFEFIKPRDYTSDYNIVNKTTLEQQLEQLQIGRLRNDIKKTIKDIIIQDKDFDASDYINILENPEADKDVLNQIKFILESELGGYEGRGSVVDGIETFLSFAEKYFDGNRTVMGQKIDLTGLTATAVPTLRKRKMETTAVYKDVKEKLGVGPYFQLGFDVVSSIAITAHNNSNSSSDLQRAVRTKERSKM